MRMFSCLALMSALGTLVQAEPAVTLREVGRYATGVYKESAAEIVAFCENTQRLFVVNAHSGHVDVLDFADPAAPKLLKVLTVAEDVGGAMKEVNSVDLHDGLLVAAVGASPKTERGAVAFYRTADLELLKAVPVGSLPDMVRFSPTGDTVLVANEGEPNFDYTVDPEGTVSVLDLSKGVENLTVRTADFKAWNAGGARAGEVEALMDAGLRVFGQVTLDLAAGTTRPATFAEDVEPEWIEVTADGRTAYVALQEANALAEIDLASATVTRILPLGFKDHGLEKNALDVSDKDGINLRTVPGLYGVYQPDTFKLFEAGGVLYAATANEGDSRVRPEDDDEIPGMEEGDLFSCETKLKKFDVAGTAFEGMTDDKDLGRYKLVSDLVKRHADADGKPVKLFGYGARSFSIYNLATGEQVFDSGSDFERITAERVPELFNVSNSKHKVDDRSRSKGPEPEGIELGVVDGRVYAFVGLERTGGVMIYDVTVPQEAFFVDYVINRTAGVDHELEDDVHNPASGDLGPEGMVFIPAAENALGRPLLVVANEVSGTTVVFEVVK